MGDIKRNIRFYQPNDPYYWQVDNLPLTDLLANDIILENRVDELETSISDIGDGGGAGGGGNTTGDRTGGGVVLSGTMSTGSISDLKAYSIPIEGNPAMFGRVYVRSGKFTARVQMPATRENGARMMRDKDAFFNNDPDALSTTNIAGEFVRTTRGLARTAVIEWLPTVTGGDRSILIPSFDDADFNNGDPPFERLDLIYIKGTKPLDCDGDSVTTPSNYEQNAIPRASLGIIKGAYFRTDSGAGLHSNGSRFTDANSRLSGRTTGMANSELPVDTLLPNFGTVPMPDDLVNFAWHRNYQETASEVSDTQLSNKQIETEAAFCLPVAYVRVGRSHREGDPINPDRVVDIRPFFRTAELSYSERAAIAASVGPNGNNPFITKFHLRNKWMDGLSSTSQENSAAIVGLLATDAIHTGDIASLKADLSGTTQVLGPHEPRIQALEVLGGEGGGAGDTTLSIEHFVQIPPVGIFTAAQSFADLGSASSPVTHVITNAIPPAHRDKLVAVQFRFVGEQFAAEMASIRTALYLKGGNLPFKKVSVVGGPTITQNSGGGNVNTFMNYVNMYSQDDSAQVSIETYVTSEAASTPLRSGYVDGYIWSQEVTI